MAAADVQQALPFESLMVCYRNRRGARSGARRCRWKWASSASSAQNSEQKYCPLVLRQASTWPSG
jgi:hypothetical protein